MLIVSRQQQTHATVLLLVVDVGSLSLLKDSSQGLLSGPSELQDMQASQVQSCSSGSQAWLACRGCDHCRNRGSMLLVGLQASQDTANIVCTIISSRCCLPADPWL